MTYFLCIMIGTWIGAPIGYLICLGCVAASRAERAAGYDEVSQANVEAMAQQLAEALRQEERK